jgi:hypothetical protein
VRLDDPDVVRADYESESTLLVGARTSPTVYLSWTARSERDA